MLVALVVMSSSLVISTVGQGTPSVTLLWTNPMEVFDVAVSRNGAYLAAVNGTPSGLFFFASSNSNNIWWWLDTLDTPLSVAISSDGNQVVVGTSTGYIHYFDNSISRSGLQTSSTWTSRDLGGGIERRTIDISDNGQYVVVGCKRALLPTVIIPAIPIGGEAVYYFADCRTRSGLSEDVTWLDYPAQSNEIFAVDLSPDGQYIAVGGTKLLDGVGGFVAYYKQASTPPFPKNEAWNARSGIDAAVTDIKVSDEGYSVAAVSSLNPSTLHYWRDAPGLSGDPADTWNSTLPYACVDTSADGNEVVAGKPVFSVCGIHFWANSKSLTGTNMTETWARHEGEAIPDVAINDVGSILAAVAVRYNAGEQYFAYFYTNEGVSIGEFQLDSFSDKISMSSMGETVAVGGGTFDSLYVFKISVSPSVGGEVVATDYLQVLTPFLLYGIAVTMGLIGLTTIRRKQ